MARRAKDTKPAPKPRTAPAGKRERAVKKAAPAKVEPVRPVVQRRTSGTSTIIWDESVTWTESAITIINQAAQYISATSVTSASVTMDTWPTWVIDSCTATTGNGTNAWVEWQRPLRAYAAEHRATIDAAVQARGRVSPEARARVEAQRRLYEEQEAQRREQRKAADRKAEILLRSVLTPDQIRDLESKAHFFMRDKHGRLYRIDRGQHGNVKLLDNDMRVVESYCIQPRGDLPDADAMAAQKLLLEADPEHFHQVANVSAPTGQLIRRGGGPQRPMVEIPDFPPLQIPQIQL